MIGLIGLGVAQVYCVPTDSRVCKRCTATREVRKRKAKA